MPFFWGSTREALVRCSPRGDIAVGIKIIRIGGSPTACRGFYGISDDLFGGVRIERRHSDKKDGKKPEHCSLEVGH